MKDTKRLKYKTQSRDSYFFFTNKYYAEIDKSVIPSFSFIGRRHCSVRMTLWNKQQRQ